MNCRNWTKVKLDDICNIKHGYAFKGEFFSDEPTKNILLTPGNFDIGGGFKSNKYKYYSGKIPSDYVLKENDVIVTMTDLSKEADTLGFSAKIPKNEDKVFLHNQRLGLVSLTNKNYDINFLYWLMRSEYYQKFIAGSATGSTVKHTSPSKILSFIGNFPPFDKQKKIAKVLSNYDTLIENNLNQIKLLEEKARITFEEWFLRFRIDGQKLNIDENIGLPFGWRTVNLGEVVDLKQGFALNKKSDHYIADKGLPLFKISDLLRETESLFVKNTIPKQFLVTEKEIIYTRTAQVGYVFMDRKGVVYNNCFKVIPKSCIYSRFIYQFLSLRSVRDLAQTLATGSAQPDLSHAAFKSIKTNYPTEEIVNKFNYMVEPIFENIQCLKKQNKLLKESRDILLPRLMTGMIDVDKMDIEV